MVNFRKLGRSAYKASGYKNPMKQGKLSTNRVIKQLPKLYKDVMSLQKMINAEKKKREVTIDNTSTPSPIVGQCNVNNSGHYILDVTPKPPQGVGYNNRNGQSIKWVSSHYSFFFQRQASNINKCTIKLQWIMVKGEPFQNTADILGKYVEPNRWIGGGVIYDNASDRKSEYFKTFKVLKTKYVSFGETDLTGAQTTDSKIVNLGFKLKNHHVKYNNNTDTLSEGQILLYVTMNSGNCSPTTVSTLDDVALKTQATGVTFCHNRLDYFYDN